jgi:hypothetical protein
MKPSCYYPVDLVLTPVGAKASWRSSLIGMSVFYVVGTDKPTCAYPVNLALTPVAANASRGYSIIPISKWMQRVPKKEASGELFTDDAWSELSVITAWKARQGSTLGGTYEVWNVQKTRLCFHSFALWDGGGVAYRVMTTDDAFSTWHKANSPLAARLLYSKLQARLACKPACIYCN